jgi:hypothetical protein
VRAIIVHIFVCASFRADGDPKGVCHKKGSVPRLPYIENEILDRGHGVGRQLIHTLADWADERGLTRLQLLADRGNQAALGFYRRIDWEPTQLVCWRYRPPSP